MIAIPGIEYLQARLQARLSGHPDAYAWRRVETARSLADALDRARDVPCLAALISGLTADAGVHAIEHSIRARLRALAHEVARWAPEAWSGAVAWTQVIADLPLLAHLHSGAMPLAWMREDAALRPYLDSDIESRRRALERGPLAPLAPHWNEAASLRRAWLAEWRRRWPRPIERALLDDLANAVAAHLQRFAAAPVADAWQAREALRAQVGQLFRRSVLHPAAAFGYLALAALDAERLRAELARRAVFEQEPALTC